MAAGRASKASVARSTPPPARTGALNMQGQLLDELSGTGTRTREKRSYYPIERQ